jgi:hypothetical protein
MKISRRLGLCVLLAVPVFARAQTFDLEIGYGRWTFSPFVSLVENETERLIEEELIRVLEGFLPRDRFSTFESIELSSSGDILTAALWSGFGRFALGLEAGLFDFRIPYTVTAGQAVRFLDFEAAALRTEGSGEVRLRSVMVSLLGRWEVLSSRRFRLRLHGGLNMLPYQGEVSLRQRTVITTPLGDVEYEGGFSQSLARLRGWNDDIPALIFAPALGADLRYDPGSRVGLCLGLSLRQGIVWSAGLCFTL